MAPVFTAIWGQFVTVVSATLYSTYKADELDVVCKACQLFNNSANASPYPPVFPDDSRYTALDGIIADLHEMTDYKM